ncbi:hypothetical protein BH11BAC3_BH11BAC3_28700 [soil metagenome]
MKNLLIVFAFTQFALVSCNSSTDTKKSKPQTNHELATPLPEDDEPEAIKMTSATFKQVDPAVSGYINSLVQHYLALKNALIEANETNAAKAATEMKTAMDQFDQSLLSVEQKKVYDGSKDALKTELAQISKEKIALQRDHFATMSNGMYNLVKAFGAGEQPLYYDECPMYKDGSTWLSEIKDIRNPFYGDKMMECGTAKEMIH